MTVTAQRTDLTAARNGTPILTIEQRQTVAVSDIQTTAGTQMRAGLNPDTVSEYMEVLDANPGAWPFPPIVVFYDGSTYHLADGFHRVAAARQKGRWTAVPADVRPGTRRDAVLHAAGANASHGLRRSNADKRRAVETLLRDEEWGQWSNMEIARRCQVSESNVRSVRELLERTSQIAKSITRKAADGRTMDVGAIGSRSSFVAPPAGPSVAPGIAVNGDRPLPHLGSAQEPTSNGSVLASAATGSRQAGSPLAKCRVCSRPLYDPAQAAAGIGACCAAKQAAGMVAGADGAAVAEPQATAPPPPVDPTWADANPRWVSRDGMLPDGRVATLEYRIFALKLMGKTFALALKDLDAWAEQTGHFTATLEAERGLKRVIELNEQELHSLGAA